MCAGLSPCEEGPLEGCKSWFCMAKVEGEALSAPAKFDLGQLSTALLQMLYLAR